MLPKSAMANLLFYANETLAVYRLPQLPYEYQAESVKHTVYQQMAIFVQQYKGRGQIIALTRPISAQDVERNMATYSRHPFWRDHIEAAKGSVGSTSVQERVLLLPVPKFDSIWESGEMKKRLFSFGKKEAPEELAAIRRSEKQLFDRIHAWIPGLKRAEIRDLEALLRAPYYRGLVGMPEKWNSAPTVAYGDELISFPMEADIADSVVWEDAFHLRIEHEDGRTSYQTVYGVSHAAKSVEPLNDEWIYAPMEKAGIPLDIVVHFNIHTVPASRTKAEKQKAIAKNQFDEYAKTGDVPQKMIDTVLEAEELVAQVARGMAVMDMHILFVIGAASEQESKNYDEHFRGQMDSWFRLARPPGETLRLWQATFPSEKMDGVEKTWRIPCDPAYLASSGVLATGIIGDPSGMLLGNLENGRPVFVDPFRPMQELNRTGSWAWIGGLGSGKSVGMKTTTDVMLQWKAVGMVISPKLDEYAGLLSRWKQDSLHLRFGADNLQFNPFLLGKDAKESQQIASGFLSTLLYVTSQRNDQYVSLVLNSALHRMYQGNRQNMGGFLTALEQESKTAVTEEERKSAYLMERTLNNYRDDPVGRTLFGTSNRALAQWPALTVASIYGLHFPSPNLQPSEWTPDQRFGVAILYLVAQLGFRRLLTLPPEQPKFLDIDEAWVLRSIPEGKALLNTMNLMGRSMNLVLMMAIQNPDVLSSADGEQNDDLTANLGWIFVGKLDSAAQIPYALRLLHLPEDDEDVRKMFSDFSSGRGFMRDPMGRVGVVNIHTYPERVLKDYFDTTPRK